MLNLAGDVGLARIMDASHMTTGLAPCGTFAYAAPELLMGTRCDEKARPSPFCPCPRAISLVRIQTKVVPAPRKTSHAKVPLHFTSVTELSMWVAGTQFLLRLCDKSVMRCNALTRSYRC